MGDIREELKKRKLILDGAMGTMLQRYQFSEEDFRGERFKDFPHSLKGNNDLLSITQPEAVKEVHRLYFQAGADIVETNTFSGTTIGMADYHLEDLVYELNYQSAKIAKEVANAKDLELAVQYFLANHANVKTQMMAQLDQLRVQLPTKLLA